MFIALLFFVQVFVILSFFNIYSLCPFHLQNSSADPDMTQVDEPVQDFQEHRDVRLHYGIQVNLPPLNQELLGFSCYCDNISETEKATQIMTQEKKTYRKATQTKSCKPLTFSAFSDRQVKSFCGVEPAVIKFLASRVEGKIRQSKLLSYEMKVCLLLVKFKLFIPFPALAAMFEIGETTARTVFKEVLDVVSEVASEGVVWFTREQIDARMPTAFRALYPQTRVIIDCSEIICERPSSARQRVLMYSHYKSNFTVKFLVGIAPSGEVMFASRGYGGRTTDTEITCNSGFLELIEDGDLVLADKGFPKIEKDVNEAGGIMVTPPFKCGERQFTAEQNSNAYKCACVRVHVERAIQRLKVFEILNFVPMHMIPYFDRTLLSCCFLINLQNDLIKK